MFVMDIDDTVLHYMLWFGGMLLATTMHRVADSLGWDIVKTITKPFRKKKTKHHKQ